MVDDNDVVEPHDVPASGAANLAVNLPHVVISMLAVIVGLWTPGGRRSQAAPS